MKSKHLHPSTAMMSYGYEPFWSEGSVKCPIYQTSTFSFHTAEDGKAFFEQAYSTEGTTSPSGLIYSRVNNPNLEIVESRIKLWDGTADAAVFNSGMAAISTCCLTFLKPGDLLLYSKPIYGGTHHFFEHILPVMGIKTVGFNAHDEPSQVLYDLNLDPRNINMLFIETPANPTNALVDILTWRTACPSPTKIVVDNTLLGPLWQHPYQLGVDLIVYSATKFIGGHSDVIAGSVSGNQVDIHALKTYRTFLGNMLSPFESWLLMRSLETLEVRMTKQCTTAQKVVDFLVTHPMVKELHYFTKLNRDSKDYSIYSRQCCAPGSIISFEVYGGESGAFAFLNALKIVKLAVSLGSTESLAQHPFTMTHASVPEIDKLRLKITPGLVRLSVGLEHEQDLIRDLELALGQVQSNLKFPETVSV